MSDAAVAVPDTSPPFLARGGEAGALLRAIDWTAHPLGPPQAWPTPLRILVDVILGSSQPMYVAWGDERTLIYNNGYAAILGLRHPGAMGRSFFEAWADIADTMRPILERAFGGEAVQMDDITLTMSRNGYPEETHFSFSYTPVHDDDGTLLGVFCACAETTEAVATLQALREKDAALSLERTRLATLVDLLPVGVNFTDARGVTLLSNPAFRSYVKGETRFQRIAEVSHEWRGFDETGQALTLDRFPGGRVMRGETVERVEFMRENPGRAPDWTQVSGAPLLDADGTLKGGLFVIVDISAQKQAQARLQELNEDLEARIAQGLADRKILADIVESSEGFIQALDHNFRFLAINSACVDQFERAFGSRPSVGDDWRAHLAAHPQHNARLEAQWTRALAGETFTVLESFGSKNPVHFELRYSPLRDRDGNLIGAFHYSHEITERVRAQEQLQHAEEQLRQAQKMEAIGQLTGGVAHDFNNLLTIIRSSVDFMRRRDLPEERRRRYVDAISDTVDRAAKLTGQLLAFARRQPLKPEVFDAGERSAVVGELMRSIVGPNVEIVVQKPSEPCLVEADLAQFETALVNLAVNARDAMDSAGRLTVTVRPGADPPGGGHSGAFAAIAVSDTGAGIAPENLARVFEPFFTTKEVGRGTGLGLSQVFGFAKQSGGEVVAASPPGEGATVTLYLPQALAATVSAAALAPEPAPAGRGASVLVVEDNPEIGSFCAQMLQDLGYEATWAANADEALRRLAADDLRYDVVFSDVVMPGMSGLELGDRIRVSYPGLPVVLTSGYSDVLAQEGAHGFELLQKPYSVEALSRVLRKAVGRRTGGLTSI